MIHLIMVVVILAGLGLIFGSFASATIWRIHKQDELSVSGTKASKHETKAWSISRGRSMCVHCKHELAPKDLVPLLSWLWLRGKCRYCRLPIDDSPYTELAMAAIFVLSYLLWPYELTSANIAGFVTWLIVVVLGVMLTVYDLRWFLLPNRLVAPFVTVSLVYAGMQAYGVDFLGGILGAVIGAALLSGIFYALFQISNGEWIGGGDVKLAIGLGLLAGSPLAAMLVLFVASTLGTFASLPQLMAKRRDLKSKIPFGPFLLLGTAVVVLFGDHAVKYLLNQ